MHLFSPRHSSSKLGSTLGLSKRFVSNHSKTVLRSGNDTQRYRARMTNPNPVREGVGTVRASRHTGCPHGAAATKRTSPCGGLRPSTREPLRPMLSRGRKRLTEHSGDFPATRIPSERKSGHEEGPTQSCGRSFAFAHLSPPWLAACFRRLAPHTFPRLGVTERFRTAEKAGRARVAARAPGAGVRKRLRSCVPALRGWRPKPALFRRAEALGYLLAAKGTKHPLRCQGAVFLVLFAKVRNNRTAGAGFFFVLFSAKSTKNSPTLPRSAACGLTLAAGDYSRVCKQTVPAARAFSPHSAFPLSASGRKPSLRHFI